MEGGGGGLSDVKKSMDWIGLISTQPCGVNISYFTLHRFLTCCSQREIQNEISECKISKLELSR